MPVKNDNAKYEANKQVVRDVYTKQAVGYSLAGDDEPDWEEVQRVDTILKDYKEYKNGK